MTESIKKKNNPIVNKFSMNIWAYETKIKANEEQCRF